MKTITMEAKVESIPVITEFVDGLLEEMGSSMKAQMQVDVALDELLSNVAYYAYKDGAGSFTVTFEVRGEDTAVITLIDQGIPYDPLAKEDPDISLSAEERPIGGLGIYLVKKTMDELIYERRDEKNILTIVKKVR